MNTSLRTAILVASRLACIAGGAVFFLWITLGEYRDPGTPLMITSLVFGGWCGNVGWWWWLRPRLR